MTTFLGSTIEGQGTPVAFPSRIAAQHARVRRTYAPEDNLESLLGSPPDQRFAEDLIAVNELTAVTPVSHLGDVEDRTGYSFDFFEKFHVRPGSFVLGNLVSTQQIAVVVYSAYRHSTHTWDAFVNNAGAGVTLLNAPSLPTSFLPQTGLTNLLLEVGPNGPPHVDTTLDFVFDEMTISPIIQLDRVVLFDVQPELPYTEVLEFLTEVMTHKDGSEMRPSLRKNPRQLFEWDIIMPEGRERSRIHNLLFDWQARIFGVPQWHEATFTSAAVAINDLTINVRSTSFADYRVGGLVLIYTSFSTFDVLELASSTGTTLTFSTPVLHTYGLNVLVMPLRTGRVRPDIGGLRYPSDAAELRIVFQVLDNDCNLASTAGWSTYNSKVLLDDLNSLNGSGAMDEGFVRNLVVLDNNTGAPSLSSPWDKGKRRSNKTFHAKGKQAVWSVRQLLHALRGRAVSFYIPTFGKDLTPTANLTSGTSTLTISNVGYARYVRERVPLNVIRVVFVNSATTPLLREIIGSSEIDGTTEQLTVDSNWPSTFTPAQVKRIEYVELSRFDSDAIRIRYALGDRSARISAPLITVFDE